MTSAPVTAPLFLPRWLVERLMFGSGRVRRFTQDTPVLPDVWLEYALDPKDFANRLTKRETNHEHPPVNLLISPFRETSAGRVAQEVRKRVAEKRASSSWKAAPQREPKPTRIIYTQLIRIVGQMSNAVALRQGIPR